ncbi:MAG: putative toxin-antitoxin system toxin component, PIN family [Undibacterium sp.]|nr:putative toxin-antitoxin system toxin component, PIN family [Undibacterium sp.]
MASSIAAQKKIKIVLDTNVCLDLFVFRDPRWTVIAQGLHEKTLIASTRSDCRDEWLAVLHYPHLPINEQTRDSIVSSFDENISVDHFPEKPIKLPNCSDKDDQKFLEFSRDAEVDYLITKDKALLKLAKKVQHLHLFTILTPDKFVAHLNASENTNLVAK